MKATLFFGFLIGLVGLGIGVAAIMSKLEQSNDTAVSIVILILFGVTFGWIWLHEHRKI